MAKCKTPGCGKRGAGSSGLCPLCFEETLYGDETDEEETLLSRVLANPIAQSLWQKGIDTLGSKFDEVTGRLDKYALAFIASQQAQRQQQTQRVTKEDPRVIMGFLPNEPLDEKKIRDRRKKLLQAYHPDKGVTNDVMAQRINQAAAELLKQV